jgi:hypothetical protein
MEINANIYIITDSQELMEQATAILSRETDAYFPWETIEPHPILPLTRTWYACDTRTGPTTDPGGWEACLKECAALLKKRGAVIMRFWSPDHPDDYCEYANTTAQGDVTIGSRCALYSFKRALGSDDIRMVWQELVSGRSQYERDAIARRAKKREANRRAKGDFEIIDDVLKKYWGIGITEEIPDGITAIGEFAFVDEGGWERMLLEDEDYEAPSLELLTIPDSVQRIETYALAYCRNLTELSIPDGVTFIGDRAFEGCETLESVKLPAKLKELGEFAFFLCDKLREISIPGGIMHIAPGTFFGCSELRRVEIPNTVVSIGKEAFMNCDSLRRITLPEGVEEIGESAFQGCSKLEKVVIPKSVKSIGQNAFKGCKMVLDEKV